MNDIDFPAIEEQPTAAVVTEVLDAKPAQQQPESAVALMRRTTLAELSAVELGIAKLKADHGATDYDITTPKGLQLAKDHRLAVREVRYQIPHTVKARKAELKEVGEALEAEAERITAELMAIEKPHDDKIKAREQQLADEKAERDRIAAERAAAQAKGIADIRAFVARANAPDMTAERLAGGIKVLEEMTFQTGAWLDPVALANAQCETLDTLRTIHAMLTEREAAAVRVEAQRIENERLAAELAAQQRQLAEQQDELDRQAQEQRQRLEREAAEAERQRREAAEAEARQRAEDEAERNRLAELEARRLQEVTTAAKSMADAIAQPAAPTPEVSAAPAEPVKPAITVDLDTTPPPPPPAAEEPATLKLGTICERLGFSLSEAFIAGLGIERRGSDKRAVLYRESDWPAIKAALITKLQELA